MLVPVGGLEPPHPKATDFESVVSTNSTILALKKVRRILGYLKDKSTPLGVIFYLFNICSLGSTFLGGFSLEYWVVFPR